LEFSQKEKTVAFIIIIWTIEFGLSVFLAAGRIFKKFISTDLRKGPLRTAREHTNAAKDY